MRAPYLLLLLTLTACSAAPIVPLTAGGTAQLLLPGGAVTGPTFTASTPFTNSIPYRTRTAQAQTAVPEQVLEIVDPQTGAVLARQAVRAGVRFVLPSLPPGPLLFMQVALRDEQGGLHGLLAAPCRPGELGQVLSPATTVAPVAAALVVDPDHPPTMGQGFAGRARGQEARMLAEVTKTARARAIAAYDPVLASEGTGAELMAAIGAEAVRVAGAIASPSTSPEALGLRLAEMLGSPAAPPWIGRGPAIPAPWPSP